MDGSSVFLAPVKQHPTLEAAVSDSLGEAWCQVPPLSSTGCFISDIDAYLSTMVSALPVIADRLVNGHHMSEYVNEQMDRMDAETDFPGLQPLDSLCENITSLRQFVSIITRAAANIKAERIIGPTNQFEIIPPSTGSSRQLQSVVSSELLRKTSRNMKSPSLNPSSTHASQSSIIRRRCSSSPADDLMTTLSSRGKGHWTCPYALNCELGGVSADGSAIVFERNSTFK
ncbi:hypothetical protein QQS21_012276 [Conoideocrella luteorostrata]|uniref:Uncharacterized protein n=1 Tax=Conoideocrella luteorostrata TaxID=1105319 RepID=A0AAJ0CBH2_9HYPO|nr:hypothetical protein QQS21_012276 [Conoideocrella luteorostrata]